MRFNLTITCDNAAFDDHTSDDGPDAANFARNEEVGRILREVVGMVEAGGIAPDAGPRTLRDHNGNAIGTAEFVTNARGE